MQASDNVVAQLTRSIRRLQIFSAILAIAIVALAATIFLQKSKSAAFDEIRTNRLVVIDDKGIKRVEIGQDAPDAGRRNRSAGMWIFDNTGHERGGMSTFDDGSTVVALDAPFGIGVDGQRDRAGLRVDADGSAQFLLTDNQTRGIVRLLSDGKGGGGVQTLKWDMAGQQIHVRTTTFDGDDRTQMPFSATE